MAEASIAFDDVVLLRQVVVARFMDGEPNAIVCALEGFKWLLGEESVVTRVSLEEEWHERQGK